MQLFDACDNDNGNDDGVTTTDADDDDDVSRTDGDRFGVTGRRMEVLVVVGQQLPLEPLPRRQRGGVNGVSLVGHTLAATTTTGLIFRLLGRLLFQRRLVVILNTRF